MDHSKLSGSEAVSNSANGKTSAGKLFGSIIITVGLINFTGTLLFLSTSIYLIQILSACFGLVFLGSSLLLGKIFKPTV